MEILSLSLVLGAIFFAYLMLFNLQRQKLSYFYNIRSLFYLWFLIFIFLGYTRIITGFINTPEAAIYRTKISIVASSIMALIFGALTAILSHYTETTSVQDFLREFFKRPHPPLAIYSAICFTVISVAIFTTPFRIIQLRSPLTGAMEYAASYRAWFEYLLVMMGTAALLYPCLTISRLSTKHKLPQVRKSLKVFAICLIIYTLSTPALTVLREYDYTEYELVYIIHTGLLALMWYGFRKPTVLASFFESQIAQVSREPLTEELSAKTARRFSEIMGFQPNQMFGRSFLLEFDPSSDYEKVILSLVSESKDLGMVPIIFTRKSSGIYANIPDKRRIQFVILTPDISVPMRGSHENETLLPIRDISLILNAVNEFTKHHPERTLIIFDSLSDLILSLDFPKTYAFTRYALENLESRKATAIFLLNPKAHDERIVSSIRSLFKDQLFYNGKEIEIIKLSGPGFEPAEVKEEFSWPKEASLKESS